MKEFNLSEKGIDKCELPFVGKVYAEKDVKESIKLLKERLNPIIINSAVDIRESIITRERVFEEINKVFGDKLTK